jgi:hypothetical protein
MINVNMIEKWKCRNKQRKVILYEQCIVHQLMSNKFLNCKEWRYKFTMKFEQYSILLGIIVAHVHSQ